MLGDDDPQLLRQRRQRLIDLGDEFHRVVILFRDDLGGLLFASPPRAFGSNQFQ